MYAMLLTRPDIAYVVSIVSKFMVNLRNEHWRAVKWILRYLKGTSSYSLLYEGVRMSNNLAEGYVDANFADDLNNRWSLIGYLFTINNCIISCKASLQSVVALSNSETIYTTTIKAFKEAIWLKAC